MQQFKKIEKLMALSSRQANQQYAKAYENVLKVYRFYDDIDSTCHCKIINALYNVNKRNCTLLGLSQGMNISDNALRRYRQRYTEWFSYFLKIAR